MDPELQGDQNAEFKPSYDVQVTRDDAPDLRETNQDYSQLAKEEAQMEKEDMNQGTSQQHLTKSGEPDKRFKENQSGQDQSSNQRGSRNQQQDNSRNTQQSEHLTKAGEPDMRFKENQETYGQS